MPSREKSVSINRLPLRNAPTKAAGKPVRSGIIALRKTCFQSTSRCGAPFARAVSTYCRPISSRKVFFVRMVTIAKLPTTDAVTGKAICHK